MEDRDEIVPGTHRYLHKRRRRHAYFGRERRQAFLEHLAATCNVAASAEAAGISHSCVYAARMRDAGFRADWAAAVEQGYARLEVELLARAARERPPVRGAKAVEGPDARGEIDWDKAMDLLRHHQRGVLTGERRGSGGIAQRLPIEALAERMIRKLRALGVDPSRDEPGSGA